MVKKKAAGHKESPFEADVIGFFQGIGRLSKLDTLTSTLIAILFLEPSEISMDELAERTGYSLASISNRLPMLESSGMVRRISRPGTKRVYLYMEKDHITMLRNQLIRREEIKLKAVKDALPALLAKYRGKLDDEADKKKLRIMEDYYRQLLHFDGLIGKILEELDAIEHRMKNETS